MLYPFTSVSQLLYSTYTANFYGFRAKISRYDVQFITFAGNYFSDIAGIQ